MVTITLMVPLSNLLLDSFVLVERALSVVEPNGPAPPRMALSTLWENRPVIWLVVVPSRLLFNPCSVNVHQPAVM